MANANIVRGFVPVSDVFGRPYNGSRRTFYKGATAGILGVGDPVIAVADSTAPNGIREIVRASTGGAITGIIVGFPVDVTNLHKSGYMLDADVGEVYVCNDPQVWFEVEEAGAGPVLTAADVGRYINSSGAIDADTVLGVSKYTINNASVSDSAGTFRLEQLVQRADNELGTNAKWLVSVNLSTEINNSAANLTAV